MDEQKRRTARRKILQYFPETGPLRRELYPKHCEFFKLGLTRKFRLAMCANRVGKCITIDSIIQTAEGPQAVRDLLGRPFTVWAWDGHQKVLASASAPFRKLGLHDCYRITMANGQWIECADHHRFLTSDGWRRLSEFLDLCDPALMASNSELFRSIRGVSALDYWRIAPSCPGDCFCDPDLCDELLHSHQDSVPTPFQPQADAQEHSRSWLHEDDWESECRYTLSVQRGRQPSWDDLFPRAAQYVEFSNESDSTSVGLLCGSRPGIEPQIPEYGIHPRSSDELVQQVHGTSLSAFVVTSNRIVSITPIGRKEVWDFTVERYHNYIAADLVHHNTEGMGGYEMVCHLTGWYPEWWPGRKFTRPVTAWAAGETAKDVRDSIQQKLLGKPTAQGTGLIFADSIKRLTTRSGVPDAIDTAYIQHASGGVSSCTFKAYEQGRESFQAADVDVLWLDEEPSLEIFTEAVTRTMTTNGIVMMTFTPLKGMSDTVLQFMPKGEIKESVDDVRAVIMATWDDAPHITPQMRQEMLALYPPFQRDARSKGIPQLGAGAIYPVPESDLIVDPFPIPPHWPQGYGMDVGWNCTAGVWGAHDRERDILYLTHEHRRSQAEPSVNAAGIRAAGDWIPGFIDPSSRGRSQRDGTQLLTDYRNLGLNLALADNGVESGLYSVWNRMSTGRLKVFRSMQNWLQEFRLYRRDEKGHVVKANDHLMDSMRYLESRIRMFRTPPISKPPILPMSRNKSAWA